MISTKELLESSSKFVSNTHVRHLQNSDSRSRFQRMRPSHLATDELKDLDMIHGSPDENSFTQEHPSFMLSPG